MELYDIGLIGLGVMGQSLALNIERNGFRVVVYNRSGEVTRAYLAGPAGGKAIAGVESLEALVKRLRRPRVILLMVTAGSAVDAVIASVVPYLEVGDILIDGGNSHFRDTERRAQQLAQDGIRFLGVGISGGEEGALWGPSLMPGGDRQAYDHVEALFKAIAARAGGEPCVTYIGPGGSGHYVKMVHNGIEYGVMQLIAETYDILKRIGGLSYNEMQEVFARWYSGPLESFLIEITADILARIDSETNHPLVDVILDKASQKGTGRWTVQEALELGVPIPTITAAVEARSLSADKATREGLSILYPRPERQGPVDSNALIATAEKALYTAELLTYTQGFNLLSAASREHQYDLTLSEIARIWRGGCIIRARLLEDIQQAYTDRPELENLLLHPIMVEKLQQVTGDLRGEVCHAARAGIPIPGLAASLAYFDSNRSERLPANLIQAQRDYFGSHTYERIDRPGSFHTDWKQFEKF